MRSSNHTAPATRFSTLSSVAIAAIAWIGFGTLAFVRAHVNGAARPLDGQLFPAYALWLTCYLPWVLLTPVVIALERRYPLGRPGWLQSLGVLTAASVVMVYAAWGLTATFDAAVRIGLGTPIVARPLTWIIPGSDFIGHQALFWASVLATCLVRTLVEAREHERRAARLMLDKSQLEGSLRQAELDVLRMRLHPHFVFNSLQNISVLTLHDPQTGSRMLTKLGDLLRASLGRDTRPETTLQAEMSLTHAYLAIEQMRFGDRLTALVTIEPGTERALVPTLLLQPIVENAIRHGLENVRQGGIIAIASRSDGQSLTIIVTDNGAGPPDGDVDVRTFGIGLGATCERLARMYPGEHNFSMRAVPEGGTEVSIMLPLRFEPGIEVATVASAAHADR